MVPLNNIACQSAQDVRLAAAPGKMRNRLFDQHPRLFARAFRAEQRDKRRLARARTATEVDGVKPWVR